MKRYTRRLSTTGYLTIAVILALCLIAQAQDQCSIEMTTGTYAITCQGDAALGTGANAFLPTVVLGTVSIDGEGNVMSGELNVSVGGVPQTLEVTNGTGVVNPDCTGSVELASDALSTGPIPGVILDQGDTIIAFSTIPGVTGLCTLNRIRAD